VTVSGVTCSLILSLTGDNAEIFETGCAVETSSVSRGVGGSLRERRKLNDFSDRGRETGAVGASLRGSRGCAAIECRSGKDSP
jgi:hypothetical protein